VGPLNYLSVFTSSTLTFKIAPANTVPLCLPLKWILKIGKRNNKKIGSEIPFVSFHFKVKQKN
jgi:hypothetical protein